MVNLILVILWTIIFMLWIMNLIDSIRQCRKSMIVLNIILIIISFLLICIYGNRVKQEIENKNIIEVTTNEQEYIEPERNI